MYKLTILTALILSGCSNFTINATMCDEIASQPNAVIPQECQSYDEKKADKAFNKVVDDKKISDKDLEVHKEE